MDGTDIYGKELNGSYEKKNAIQVFMDTDRKKDCFLEEKGMGNEGFIKIALLIWMHFLLVRFQQSMMTPLMCMNGCGMRKIIVFTLSGSGLIWTEMARTNRL